MVRNLVLLAAILLTLAPAAAHATYVVGARQMGSAGAFVATSPDASSLQSNPAAAAADEGLELQADLGGLSWFGYAPTNSRDDLLFGPLQFDLFGTAKIAAGVTLGVALAPLWGSEHKASSSYSLSPSISFRVADFLALAVGAQLNRTHLESQVIIVTVRSPIDDLDAKGTVHGVGGTAGVLVTLLDNRFTLGIGLRTPLITIGDGATLESPFIVESAIAVEFSNRLRAGVELALSGEESLTTNTPGSILGLAFEPISSSTSSRLGVEWEFVDGMWIRSGLAYDQQKHPFTFADLRNPSFAVRATMTSTVSAALGFGFSLSSRLSADIAGILEQPRGSDSLRLRAGLGLVWKQP